MFNENKGGGPVVKNLPYDAEDVSSIPGQGTKVPHLACEPQLERSLCATDKTRHSQINKLKKKIFLNKQRKENLQNYMFSKKAMLTLRFLNQDGCEQPVTKGIQSLQHRTAGVF